MTRTQFIELIQRSIAVGVQLDNPGDGTTRISSVTDDSISYVRGSSTIRILMSDLHRTYLRFRGSRVSSRDLRQFAPDVFDSAARPAGHSCNCTFFFRLLQRMELAGPVEGAGVKGDPFAVTVY